MNPIPARNLLLLLSFTSLVAAATNFTQCLEDFKANSNATGGVNSHGGDVSAADAVGLKYETCTQLCGATAESFSWRQFAQLFSSWLLPWLALISQLPFGSGNHVDNFLSVFISVGSPALAAYSLMITSFNTNMVYKKASSIDHLEKVGVAKALVAIQQTPLRVTTDSNLLESIRSSNRWRHEILERLNKRNAWSLATGFSVAWVVIAFAFTLVDSFVALGDPSSGGSDGLAVSTLWLWLLCLVIGWLWIPIFPSSEINAAIRHANNETGRNPKASKKPGAVSTFTVDVEDENGKVNQESTHGVQSRTREASELGFTPSSTSLRVPAENQQDRSHFSIGGIQTAQHSTIGVARSAEAQPPTAVIVPSLKQGHSKLLIPRTNHIGFLHVDEFRHPATFNYSRIMWYLLLVDDIFNAFTVVDHDKRSFSEVDSSSAPKRATFPPEALCTMFKAAFFALLLQCGITGAAVIIIVYTPTVGLGCRSVGYTVYGVVAVAIMFLTIVSTILARISETRKGKSPFVGGVTAFFAVALRWTCYSLALLNSVGLIALSCIQFSNFFDNCYCNSSVIGRGTNTYIVIVLQDLIPTMRHTRAIGIGVAAASISVFMIALGLISSTPEEMRGF